MSENGKILWPSGCRCECHGDDGGDNIEGGCEHCEAIHEANEPRMDQYPPCQNCGKVAPLEDWGGTNDRVSLARNPRLIQQWCRRCILEAQVAHMREIVPGLAKVEAELAALNGVAAQSSAPSSASPEWDLIAHLTRQRAFSERTFGPGQRTAGVVDHIRKELREIEAAPTDLSEWVDVILLAPDGNNIFN